MIPDNSVDLIFTDPPYPKEFMHCYESLGQYALRILKPGGSILTLLGQYQLPEVMYALRGLSFHWIGWLNHSQKRSLFGYRIVCGGKPILWYTKGKTNRPEKGFWWDTISPQRADKAHHIWGQPTGWAEGSILRLTEPGEIVLDPFCGGGTVPAVCKMQGRKYLSFEIDQETCNNARERIRNLQMPLFTLEPEQLALEV